MTSFLSFSSVGSLSSGPRVLGSSCSRMEIWVLVTLGVAIGAVGLLVYVLCVARRQRVRGKTTTILLAGLPDVGKTSLYLRLWKGEIQATHSSMMENTAEVTLEEASAEEKPKTTTAHLVDYPGDERLRGRMFDYTPVARGIVYLIDATDPRYRENAEFLFDILADKHVSRRRIPLLIVCNKTDIDSKDPRSSEEIREELETEMEELRKTRSAMLEAHDGDSQVTIIGVEGEDFLFEHVESEITFTEASVLKGRVKDIVSFIHRCLG